MSPEFASVQLTLVDRFVALDLGTCADGVHQLTNFQRRLGLGTPTNPPSGGPWLDLVNRLAEQGSHDRRVNTVMAAFEKLPPAVPEHLAQSWPTVGAFSVQVAGPVARTHFFSMDTDSRSPLHPEKDAKRRSELRTVLSTVYADNPQLTHVVGGSWMYTTRSYGSLFPEVHVRNAQVRRNRRTFRGMSHWGQFLNHRWQVRSDLAEEFRARVQTWEGNDPCLLFPIDTLEVSSPITAFDLAAQPADDL
jgi:hypothetical protein